MAKSLKELVKLLGESQVNDFLNSKGMHGIYGGSNWGDPNYPNYAESTYVNFPGRQPLKRSHPLRSHD